jgi:hypothetical protein
MANIAHDALGVNDDRPSVADLLWWQQQNLGYHDQDESMPLTDLDCSIDFELQQEMEVERWFRSRPVDRPGDMDQPWYRYLGCTGAYRDCI